MLSKSLSSLFVLHLTLVCAARLAARNPSWSWNDCGSASDPLRIDSFEVSPSPPKPGQDVTIRVVGAVVSTIKEGAYGQLTISLGNDIRILDEKHDLCDDARNENLGFTCPVSPGKYTVTKTFTLPEELPSTKYKVHFEGYTVDREPLKCVDLTADFSKA